LAADLENFGLNILATLIGVFAGFFLSMRWDRRRKANDEKVARRRIMEGLRDELGTNAATLEDMDKNQRYAFVTSVFLKDVYQSAIASGGLALLDNELLIALGDSYRHLREMDTWSDVIRSMVSASGGFNSENVKQVIKLMEFSGKEALKSVSDTIELVKKRIGTSATKPRTSFPYFWVRSRPVSP
jgi:uncharacterized protein YneF (UPF0154 family)